MTRPTVPANEASDAEILAGVRSKMTYAEALIPQPPVLAAWTMPARRTVLRSRVGFAGLVPLILVVALVAVITGVGMGLRSATPGSAVPTTNLTGAVVSITYRLVPPGGRQPSDAELKGEASALNKRLSFIFPLNQDSAGSWVPATPGTAYEAFAWPPDEVVVRYNASYRMQTGALVIDAEWIRAAIDHVGAVDFVGLPESIYGTSAVAGSKPLPVAGGTVDSAVPLLTDRDVEGGGFDELSLQVSFSPSAGQRLADYSATHPGGYMAVLVDGRVFATGAIAGSLVDGRLMIPVGTGLSAQDGATLGLLLPNGILPVPLTEVAYQVTESSPRPEPSALESIPTQALGPSTPANPTSTLSTPAAAATFMVYVVRSGDTLDSIAARFNVSLARLEAANPGLDPNGLLLVGTRLNMPPPAEHSPSAEHSPAP